MIVDKIRHWYLKHEKHLASIALIGGFVFDILTLRRVDNLWENFWIIFHLVVVAVTILIFVRRRIAWLTYLMQFSFGGLLSAFLILYFRSSSLSASWPFLLILALAFAANERLKGYHEKLVFQISFLYLSVLSFAIFSIPVVVGAIGPAIFLLSGVVSLAFMKFFGMLLDEVSGGRYSDTSRDLRRSVIAIFLAMNVMYFANIIPPIPLSLKEAHIYHYLERRPSGDYLVSEEDKSIIDYLRIWNKVHLAGEGPLYAYTSVFSPARIDTDIVHEWQLFDEDARRWKTVSRISLPISGGRVEGYRTYSSLGVRPGRWRVNVLTPKGLVLGRIGFDVVETPTNPELVTEVR